MGKEWYNRRNLLKGILIALLCIWQVIILGSADYSVISGNNSSEIPGAGDSAFTGEPFSGHGGLYPEDLNQASFRTEGVNNITIQSTTGASQSDIQLTWQKSLGGSGFDSLSSMIPTKDGGFLIGGYSNSNNGDVTGNHGSYDGWVVYLDDEGTIAWQKSYGGSASDSLDYVVQTIDGGYLAGGESNSNDGDVTGNHGNADYWVVKLDDTGNISWQKSLGGSDIEYVTSVIQTTDGGFLIGGTTRSNDGDVTGNHGNADYWVVKLDGDGNLQWQKCFGGSDNDFAQSVIQTSDGGFLIGGYSSSNNGNVTGNHGNADYWIVKLDDTGNLIWQKCLGGSGYDYAYSVTQTTDRGFLIGGYTTSNDGDVTGNHGGPDYWVVKLDNAGNITWQKCLGGTRSDYGESVIQTTDGGFLIGGETYSNNGDVSGNHGLTDYWVVKLDPTGNLLWQKCLGGSAIDAAKSMIQINNGEYLIGGRSKSKDGDVVGNHGNYDYWLTRIIAEHAVIAIADPWTIVWPGGNHSYIEGTNATYLTQPKPGTDLVNVTVDGECWGILNNWTFTTIVSNHTISTAGIPTPGQVHPFFAMNTTWGAIPLTIAFTNQSLGNPTSFFWEFGDGKNSTDQDPVHTYTTPGTYSVTLRAMNHQTGGIATLHNAVTATAGAVPSPTPTPVPGGINVKFSADQTTGPAPLQVSFVDQSTGNPTSWLWDLGDGIISTSQNVTHIYATKGAYSVTLSVQNSLSTGSLQKNGFIITE